MDISAFLIFILILIVKSVEQLFFVNISIGRILRNFRDNSEGMIYGNFLPNKSWADPNDPKDNLTKRNHISLEEMLKFRKKINEKWGNNVEIHAILELAGVLNRAISDGWVGTIRLSNESEKAANGLVDISSSQICMRTIQKWVVGNKIDIIGNKNT